MTTFRSIAIPAAASAAALLALAGTGFAGPGDDTNPVPAANPRAAGLVTPNVLTDRLVGRDVVLTRRAEGSMPVENPTTVVPGVKAAFYGYYDNGPMMPAYGDVQSTSHNVEATKSEGDKNTYLVLCGQHGPDASYDYGSHFVYAGHELGPRDSSGVGRSYLTRVNLDADAAHRVTVLATADKNGVPVPAIDGSTWYPFSKVLLFTAEGGAAGGAYMATPDWPSTVTDMAGIMGRGGYEGIQADSDGNLWIVEDVGGASTAANPQAKQPNSFVYRFVPKNTSDLNAGGKLQVLQVGSLATPGSPIVFHTGAGAADADIQGQDVLDLHTYGNSFSTKWITIHDTLTDGTAPFDANPLAKSKLGTPFKRPENGVFRPGTKFRDFYFTETGDTNALTQAGSTRGGFGGLFKLHQNDPSASTGTLTLFYRGDVAHTGLDNIQFLTDDLVLACEDAGDGLHGQRNALDSCYMFDCDVNYGAAGAPAPVRILAEGRDPSATTDAGLSGKPGYQNDGDNEITGIHVSDGDPTTKGILGAKKPKPFRQGWRFFWSQQHGDNVLWEVVEPRHNGGDDDCGCDRD